MRFNWQACFFTATSFEQIRGLGKKKVRIWREFLLVRKLIETSGSNMLILSGPPIIIPCKKTQVIVISKFYLKNLKGSPKIPKNTRLILLIFLRDYKRKKHKLFYIINLCFLIKSIILKD
jgi:hypothetical protein